VGNSSAYSLKIFDAYDVTQHHKLLAAQSLEILRRPLTNAQKKEVIQSKTSIQSPGVAKE